MGLLRKVCLLWFVCVPFSVVADSGDVSIFNLINTRLSYMKDVALYKANHQLAIEDLSREKIVLASSNKSASTLGLNPEKVDAFFKAQISVAKAIQYRYRAQWLASPSQDTPLNLATEVRPALIKLGKQLNIALATYVKQGGQFVPSQFKAFSEAIKVKYVTESDKKLLFNGLIGVTQ